MQSDDVAPGRFDDQAILNGIGKLITSSSTEDKRSGVSVYNRPIIDLSIARHLVRNINLHSNNTSLLQTE